VIGVAMISDVTTLKNTVTITEEPGGRIE